MDGIFVTFEELLKQKAYYKNYNFKNSNTSYHDLTGNYLSPFHSKGMEFKELRAYSEGDDTKTIDWKKTAKTGKMHTKIFVEEKQKAVYIILDLRASMFFATKKELKSVLSAKIASKLLWVANNTKDSISVIVLTKENMKIFPLRNSKNHLSSILKYIASISEKIPTDYNNNYQITDAIKKLIKIPYKSLIFIISDFYDFFGKDAKFSNIKQETKKQIKYLSSRYNLTIIFIYDEIESNFPLIKKCAISDGKNIEQINISANFAKNYNISFLYDIEDLKKFLKEYKASFVMIKTSDDADYILKKTILVKK